MSDNFFNHDLEIIKRLKRANGHLTKVIAMMEAGVECINVTQQLFAVEKAVSNAKKILIHNHVDHCLEKSVDNNHKNTKSLLNEFKIISKYL